jgi:hypothetical protein
LKAAAPAHLAQLWAKRIGATVIPKEIRFRLQVAGKAMNGALIQTCLLGKIPQLKPMGSTIQKFKNRQNLRNDTNGSRLRFRSHRSHPLAQHTSI